MKRWSPIHSIPSIKLTGLCFQFPPQWGRYHGGTYFRWKAIISLVPDAQSGLWRRKAPSSNLPFAPWPQWVIYQLHFPLPRTLKNLTFLATGSKQQHKDGCQVHHYNQNELLSRELIAGTRGKLRDRFVRQDTPSCIHFHRASLCASYSWETNKNLKHLHI